MYTARRCRAAGPLLLLGAVWLACAAAAADATARPSRATPAEQAVSVDYWKRMCPSLHVSSADAYPAELLAGAVPTAAAVGEAEGEGPLQRLRAALAHDGYFVADAQGTREEAWSLPPGASFAAMAECVAAVRKHGWPSVFVFVFDEFWLVMRRMRRLLRDLLGEDAVHLQMLWAYRIDAESAEQNETAERAGWFAHRDRPWRGNGYHGAANPPYAAPWPPSVNVWVPLSVAAADNGCMYLYPKGRDPAMQRHAESGGALLHDPDAAPFLMQPEDLRALPAAPGQFMLWDGEVYHWGSRANPGTLHGPRISFNFEAARNASVAAAVTTGAGAFWPLELLPGFAFRLRAVEATIKQFAHMGDARVLPERTRDFCVSGALRAVAERLPCGRDCEQLIGGLCAQPGMPRDTPPERCPRRTFQ